MTSSSWSWRCDHQVLLLPAQHAYSCCMQRQLVPTVAMEVAAPMGRERGNAVCLQLRRFVEVVMNCCMVRAGLQGGRLVGPGAVRCGAFGVCRPEEKFVGTLAAMHCARKDKLGRAVVRVLS